jgi:hypothetical protein
MGNVIAIMIATSLSVMQIGIGAQNIRDGHRLIALKGSMLRIGCQLPYQVSYEFALSAVPNAYAYIDSDVSSGRINLARIFERNLAIVFNAGRISDVLSRRDRRTGVASQSFFAARLFKLVEQFLWRGVEISMGIHCGIQRGQFPRIKPIHTDFYRPAAPAVQVYIADFHMLGRQVKERTVSYFQFSQRSFLCLSGTNSSINRRFHFADLVVGISGVLYDEDHRDKQDGKSESIYDVGKIAWRYVIVPAFLVFGWLIISAAIGHLKSPTAAISDVIAFGVGIILIVAFALSILP